MQQYPGYGQQMGYGSPPSVPPCPSCGAHIAPQVIRKTSTLGWVVFWVFIWLCLVGAVGLLFKSTFSICPTCGFKRMLHA